MKILLGNNTLDILAGSETWTYTLALALKKLGHEVTAFSPVLGTIAMKLSAEGIKCVKEIGGDNSVRPYNPVFEETEGSFDVIICNHHDISVYLRSKLPKTPIIATIHGILHKSPDGQIWPEHPALGGVVNQFVAVSEEVKDILKFDYNLDSVIIRNFFDLERFKKDKKLPEKPKAFLVNSNYWGVGDPINNAILDAARILDCKLLGIGVNFSPTFEVEKIMEDVDVVFGMGRSIMEGAAMGKLAYCHGRWGTGGAITPDRYEELKRRNFSGRDDLWQKRPGEVWTGEKIAQDIKDNFNQKNVDAIYKIIKKDHEVISAAKKYVEIAESLIK